MIAFIVVCLYIFAGCVALGLLPAALIAARARQHVMIAVTLLVVAFVIFVLITAATELQRH